jgi:arylamine N-acetyltransferase
MEAKSRGRPKKIQAHIEEIDEKAEDMKAKRLEYKNDHLEEIRQKQNARYQKIKEELQLKRLLSNVFSEKFTDEQRVKLSEKLAEHIGGA